MENKNLKEFFILLDEQVDIIYNNDHRIAHALARMSIDWKKFLGDAEKIIQTIYLAEQEVKQARDKIKELKDKINGQ